MWGRREREYRLKHKGPQPLDKELEAWYDDSELDDYDEEFLRETGVID